MEQHLTPDSKLTPGGGEGSCKRKAIKWYWRDTWDFNNLSRENDFLKRLCKTTKILRRQEKILIIQLPKTPKFPHRKETTSSNVQRWMTTPDKRSATHGDASMCVGTCTCAFVHVCASVYVPLCGVCRCNSWRRQAKIHSWNGVQGGHNVRETENPRTAPAWPTKL